MGGMSGAVTWDMVGAIFLIASAVVGIVIWVTREFASVRRSIEAHKLYAAEHYATKDGVTNGLHRVEAELHRMNGRMDSMLNALVKDSQK